MTKQNGIKKEKSSAAIAVMPDWTLQTVQREFERLMLLTDCSEAQAKITKILSSRFLKDMWGALAKLDPNHPHFDSGQRARAFVLTLWNAFEGADSDESLSPSKQRSLMLSIVKTAKKLANTLKRTRFDNLLIARQEQMEEPYRFDVFKKAVATGGKCDTPDAEYQRGIKHFMQPVLLSTVLIQLAKIANEGKMDSHNQRGGGNVEQMLFIRTVHESLMLSFGEAKRLQCDKWVVTLANIAFPKGTDCYVRYDKKAVQRITKNS